MLKRPALRIYQDLVMRGLRSLRTDEISSEVWHGGPNSRSNANFER